MLKKIVGTIWKNLTPYLRLKIIRATQQKFTISVAAIIINENEEVLLLDHVLRPFLSWGIPGGFVKRGEQPEEAVRREIREETGMELQDLKLFRVRTISHHMEILFRAKGTGKAEVKSREINAAAWVSVENMPENMSEEEKLIVKRILRIK